MPKNWIAVASATHARRGCEGGYMQVCHGKLAAIRRVHPGDRVVYYSPTVTMGGKDSCQRFVSIGLVQAGAPYPFDMGGGFVPNRRDIVYVPAQEASILPLLDVFEFVENRQRWGYKFRFGLFDVSDHDMRLIAQAMGAPLETLRFL
nr:EVE domain-containing protein [Rhodoferax sp.]